MYVVSSVIKRFFLYHQVLHSSTAGLTSAETGHIIVNDISQFVNEVAIFSGKLKPLLFD